MKIKLFSILVILAIALAGITQSAQAFAYNTSFTTSITYQNVGTAATTTLQILFYANPTDTAPIVINRANLAAGAGTSVSIGTLGAIGAGFKGSAVMQADQPLLATLVQVPGAHNPPIPGDEFNRPLSNGFSGGAAKSLIATVLKNQFSPMNDTVFSVQNVDSENNNIEVKFYDLSATLVEDHTFSNVAPGAAVYWDTGLAGDPLPNPFNGSAVILATRSGGGDGAIVSSAMELEVNGLGAKAFQGVAQGALKFFMPSALCNYYGTSTAYAVQNTDLATQTIVTVTYSNGATQQKTAAPGSKVSFQTCQASAPMAPMFIGAATITSSATPVIAIGKVGGAGLSTAFEGVADGQGSAKIALPYVRWASQANFDNGTQQRTNIAIQNIGSAAITGNITVDYISCLGVIQGTDTIAGLAAGAKYSSNASKAALTQFGLCGGGGPQFGGSVLINAPAGSQLAVVARVQTKDLVNGITTGEDYDGLNVLP